MPVKVPLDIIPPGEDDIAALVIYEAPASSGPWTQIERVTEIGSYPDYITRHTTALAVSATDWFSIAWENTDGLVGPQSSPWQGGTTSLVQKLIDRVHDRAPELNERVVAQEAETSIQTFLGDTVDPYDPLLTVSYKVLSGLTYMVLARTLMSRIITQAQVDSATLGLVSFKNSANKTVIADVSNLIELAERDLGIGGSRVIDMEGICRIYGGPDWQLIRNLLTNDQEFAFIPWTMKRVEIPSRSGR